jgi:ferredoxin
MKVHLELDLCDGHGQCVDIAPDIFDFLEDGRAYIKMDPIGEEHRKLVESAVLHCPPEAISIED